MQNNTLIIAVTAIVLTTALTYHFMPAGGSPVVVTSATSEKLNVSAKNTNLTLDIENKLDKLTSDLLQYNQAYQDQLLQSQQEQARLNNILADLDIRIKSVEEKDESGATERALSNEEDANDGTESANAINAANKYSEEKLSRWVDETFDVGYRDDNLTAQASEQASVSIASLPDVNLEEMQCSDRVCRATLTYENDGLAVQDLFGEPPFVNEGFTINLADGRVQLYFTQPGVSLGDLQSEVQ